MSSSITSLKSEDHRYAMDHDLYESSVKIRDEMNLMTNRIAKMEEHKKEISEAVYLRVKSDYLAKHDLIKKEFEKKKKEIHKVLLNLYKGQREEESELQKHREILEEAQFRNKLGEYSDKKAKEIESKENVEVKQHEELLSLIQTNIKQYEDLMGGSVEEDLQEEFHKEPIFQNFESEKKEEFYAGTEGDYFELGEDLFGEVSSHIKKDKKRKEKSFSLKEEPSFKKPTPPKEKEIEKNVPNELEEDSISSFLKDIPLEQVEEQTGQLDIDEKQESVTPALKASSPKEVKTRAKLVSVEGDLQPPEIELGESISLGRSPSNDVVLKEAKISRQHATIQLQGDQHILIDLKSSNGVLVNGEKIEEHTLQDGDEISIGSYRLIYRLTS